MKRRHVAGAVFLVRHPVFYDKVLSQEQNFVPAPCCMKFSCDKEIQSFNVEWCTLLWFHFFLSFLKKLLASIAQTTGGMYVMVQNMDELSTFFKRQVLLSRFIAKFAHGKLLAV